MTLTDIEGDVEEYVEESTRSSLLSDILPDEQPHVIKYLPPKRLEDTLRLSQLYASERAGFTWGDAIYAAPLSRPLSTMMYGQVGVVGSYPRKGRSFFDARCARGIDLYQNWIQRQTRPYTQLTTTVHASAANQELRNAFRTRFRIDCVLFRPDEPCQAYVDTEQDTWLAITHWAAVGHGVGSGFSQEVTGLKWCVVASDAFEAHGLGYTAYLYESLTGVSSPYAPQRYVQGHYSSLSSDVAAAYAASDRQVVICDFN